MTSGMADNTNERGVWVTQAHMRLTGSPDCALFLAQCVYWSECKTVQKRSGWFYKTRNEWQEETCLSRYKQEKARQKLRDMGILQERHKRRNDGIRLWYRINLGLLNRLLNEMNLDIDDSPVCMDDQTENTGVKEEYVRQNDIDVKPTDTKSVDTFKKTINTSFKACVNSTNVPENNTTKPDEYQCFSLNSEDYVFCHVFIYQFVKTQLQGTIQRTLWQMYGLSHEDLFNRFCEFIDRHGQAMMNWYRDNADLDVPTLNGDDIIFCNIAGRCAHATN